MILEKEKELHILLMVVDMKVTIKMGNGMVKESDIILVEIDMKENGKMVIKKEKEYFIGKMEDNTMMIDMKVTGKMVLRKEKEFIIGKMVIDMREIGKMIL